MNRNLSSAFTLVELIVVVTIIAILATIAYVFFDGNLADARDAKRNTDLNEIAHNLELYQTKVGTFPDPSNAINITYSGSAIAWTQGTFGESVAQKIKVFGVDYPKDPLFKNEYTYSITNQGREYQIAAIHETFQQEEGLGELASLLTSQTYAASLETAFIMGDYNGFMVRAKGDDKEYFIASPSIIANDVSNPDVIHIIAGRKLAYLNFFNLPHSYGPFMDVEGGFDFNVLDPVVFSGASDDLKNENNLLAFDEKLKYIYATTPTESFDKYISILNQDGLTNLKGFLTRKFKIAFRSYFNCKDILDDGVSIGDGKYIIDTDGDGPLPSYEVYCDMTTDGGGWTRVGDNQLVNGGFSGGSGIVDALANTSFTNEIVALTTPIDGNMYGLHQTGNYSSSYKVGFSDPSILKPGYEIRMSLWRADYGSGAIQNDGVTNVTLMGGKNTPWTLGTCTSGSNCYFKNFNTKLAHAANFGPGGALSDINISVKNSTGTVTSSYLDGGVLFDGYIPSTTYNSNYGGIYPYTNAEKIAIDNWVKAGGFLISTNNESSWDPMGEYYNMPTVQYNDGRGVLWDVQNIDHPLVNGSIGLNVDLRGKTLVGTYAHAALGGTVLPGDIILAKDHFYPYAPTVLLRKLEKGYILFVSDDGMFVQMNTGNTFDSNDFETVFAAAIMAYGIETAAGINPHEGYVFHNRVHYSDGTFSTNGEDKILKTITVDEGGTPRIWSYEQTRHHIYKTPESFDWYIGLDANNNKDLYYTGISLELYYR